MQNEQVAAPRRVSAAGIAARARKSTAAPTVTSIVRKRTSAAGLSVPAGKPVVTPAPTAPACEPLRTRAEERALFDRLRALRDSLPRNKNDRAVAVISACIAGGICTRRSILAALGHLGFHYGQAIPTLDKNTGGSVARHRWSIGGDGRYRLLE